LRTGGRRDSDCSIIVVSLFALWWLLEEGESFGSQPRKKGVVPFSGSVLRTGGRRDSDCSIIVVSLFALWWLLEEGESFGSQPRKKGVVPFSGSSAFDHSDLHAAMRM